MDLSIIIVSWKVKDRLRENLTALFASFRPLRLSASEARAISFEVFVVDNNSADGTVEMVNQEFPQVTLIANQENAGFAKANNQAIKLAKGNFILLLNPDMKIYPDSLVKMIEWMRTNPQASLAGCHLIDEKGETIKHVRRFPTIWNQLAIILKLPHLLPKILDHYIISDFDYQKAAKVDSIRGGFFLICKETIQKVGLLDERFFVWFEEVDYCRQIQQVNGQVWYVAEAQCLDQVGQSFQQVKTIISQRYFRNSMIKYFQKWQPARQAKILQLAWFIVWPFMCLISLLGWKGRAKT